MKKLIILMEDSFGNECKIFTNGEKVWSNHVATDFLNRKDDFIDFETLILMGENKAAVGMIQEAGLKKITQVNL